MGGPQLSSRRCSSTLRPPVPSSNVPDVHPSIFRPEPTMKSGLRLPVRVGVWVAAAVLPMAARSGASAQQPAELLIRNAVIVTSNGRVQSDLRIRGGVIDAIGPNLAPAPGARVIDGTGKLVLPGGIDTHVHLTPVR